MALFYRVVAFGAVRGPWRVTKRLAEADAAAQGLGAYDEADRFYLDAGADFEWVHEDRLNEPGAASRGSSTRIPGPRFEQARCRA